MDFEHCKIPMKRPCSSSTSTESTASTTTVECSERIRKKKQQQQNGDVGINTEDDPRRAINTTTTVCDNQDNAVASLQLSWIKVISATYGPCEESFFGQGTTVGVEPNKIHDKSVAGMSSSSSSILTSPSVKPGSRCCLPFVKALIMIALVEERGGCDTEGPDENGKEFSVNTNVEKNRESLFHGTIVSYEKNSIRSMGSMETDLVISPPMYDAICAPLTVNGVSRTFVGLLGGTGGREQGRSMNEVFGDPCPGTSKQLHITYTVTENGMTEIFHETFAEHERVTIRRRLLLTSKSRSRPAYRQDPPPRVALSDHHEIMDGRSTSHGRGDTTRQLQSTTVDLDAFEVILPNVFPYLEVHQRMQCRQVCTNWKMIIAESGVATTIDTTDRAIAPYLTRPFLRGILRYSYQSLRSLVLSGFKDLQKDDLHPSIPHLHILRTIDLTQCRHLDDSTCQLLARHVSSTLQVLYLKGLRKITDTGLSAICRSCRSLEVLDISHISSITDEGGSSINHLVKLQALFLRDNFRLTNRSLDNITKCCSRLSQLTLWGCIKMNHLEFCRHSLKDDRGGGKLVILNLSGCYSLGNDAAQAIGQMNHLSSLIVDECHQLTDFFFELLLAKSGNLPRLQHLHLRYLRLLTDRGLRMIAHHLKELISIDLSFCTNISCDGVYELLEARHETLAELCLKSCRNLEISVPRRGPDGRFVDLTSWNGISNELNQFRPNRFDGLGESRNMRADRRNLATNTGHWILNALRPRGVDSALCILDVRCCDGKPVDYRYDSLMDDFPTGMSALNFEQSVPGYFVRPIGPKRGQRAVRRIYQSILQTQRIAAATTSRVNTARNV